jgi:hypothetical protein
MEICLVLYFKQIFGADTQESWLKFTENQFVFAGFISVGVNLNP